MKPTLRSRLFSAAILLAVVLFASAVFSQQGTQVHITPSAPAPIAIAVLADNFGEEERALFEESVNNLFTDGLFAHHFFGERRDAFSVRADFKPGSPYRIKVETGMTSCAISWDAGQSGTSYLIEQDAARLGARYAIVIGKYDYNIGCAVPPWAYVTTGTIGQVVVHHEVGHLLGLSDEFGLVDRAHPDAPIVHANSNCSTDVNNPHWRGLPEARSIYGCDLFNQSIIHAYPDCLMGPHGTTFCRVCRAILDREKIECARTPWRCDSSIPQPSIAHRGAAGSPGLLAAGMLASSVMLQQPLAGINTVRLLVKISKTAGNLPQVIGFNDSMAPPTVRNRRLGDFVYELTDGTTVLGLGVVEGNPFHARSYRGGVSQHQTAEQQEGTILLMLPNETKASMLKRGTGMTLRIYKLGPGAGSEPITRERLNALRESKAATVHAEMDGTTLSSQLKDLDAKK